MLEGPDGSGKSTQARLLVDRLRREGYRVRHLREPGGTRIGERVRELLLDRRRIEMDRRTELLLYMASRAQLCAELLQPALEAGEVVVCERFVGSSIVYQGMAGGLGPQAVRAIGRFATRGLRPDRTVFLELTAAEGLGRLRRAKDRLEAQGLGFHRAVVAGFRRIARWPEWRPRRVSARGTVGDISERVWKAVQDVLPGSDRA